MRCSKIFLITFYFKMAQQQAKNGHLRNNTVEPRKKSIQKDHVVGNYKIGKRIGKGAYGTVHEAFKISTGQKFAVKIISFDEATYESVKYEATICQQLSHENIVKIEEVFEALNKIFIFMEYCQKGQLFEFVKNNGPLSEEVAGKIFVQLYSAVKYLHLKNIAHRDIKAENVLLDAQMNPKLIDFGLAREYNAFNPMMETFCGSPSYVAPEIIKKQKYVGEKVDVWSLGVTLYVMLEAAQPFYAKSNTETKAKIVNFKWSTPSYSSRQAIELYEQIFVPSPRRIYLYDIQNCPFFEKYHGKKPRYQRYERRSTLKTERLSTNEGSQFMLPEIAPTHRRKESLKAYLENGDIELKTHENLYNSILFGEYKEKIDQKRRSVDLKNMKGDFRVKVTPTKNPKQLGFSENLAYFKREVISNLNYY